MIVIINLTVNINGEQKGGGLVTPSYQTLYDREALAFEARKAVSHHAKCDRCGFWEGWYATKGRAKMALSGHQGHCRELKTE